MQSKSKIGHFGIFVLRDEHISGCEVAMNHITRFKIFHTLTGVPEISNTIIEYKVIIRYNFDEIVCILEVITELKIFSLNRGLRS